MPKFIEILVPMIAILVALSGWATLYYLWYTSTPRVTGRIMGAMMGDMPNPKPPPQTLTAFNLYVYLTNSRKSTVHLLDYELEVDVGNGYEKIDRVYGAHSVPNWTFESPTHTIRIPDYPQKLIYAQSEPVRYGVPLHGFVLFASRKPQAEYATRLKTFRLTCIDAFQNRHEITARPSDLPDILLLQDLAGIKLTPK